MSGQVFMVPLSPAQRWALVNLTHRDSARIPNGAEGRKYRRFCRAFGLSVVTEILRDKGEIPAAAARDERTLYLHELTIENVEQALAHLNAEKTPIQEELLGDLFDLLEDAKGGRELPPYALEAFDPEKDRHRWLKDEDERGGLKAV